MTTKWPCRAAAPPQLSVKVESSVLNWVLHRSLLLTASGKRYYVIFSLNRHDPEGSFCFLAHSSLSCQNLFWDQGLLPVMMSLSFLTFAPINLLYLSQGRDVPKCVVCGGTSLRNKMNQEEPMVTCAKCQTPGSLLHLPWSYLSMCTFICLCGLPPSSSKHLSWTDWWNDSNNSYLCMAVHGLQDLCQMQRFWRWGIVHSIQSLSVSVSWSLFCRIKWCSVTIVTVDFTLSALVWRAFQLDVGSVHPVARQLMNQSRSQSSTLYLSSPLFHYHIFTIQHNWWYVKGQTLMLNWLPVTSKSTGRQGRTEDRLAWSAGNVSRGREQWLCAKWFCSLGLCWPVLPYSPWCECGIYIVMRSQMDFIFIRNNTSFSL